jgi:hypothetical protein
MININEFRGLKLFIKEKILRTNLTMGMCHCYCQKYLKLEELILEFVEWFRENEEVEVGVMSDFSEVSQLPKFDFSHS